MGVAVVRALEGDEPPSSGVLFGQFERAFVGFGAGIDEVHGVQRRRQHRREAFGEAGLRCLHELAVDHRVKVAIHLVVDGLPHLRMAVAEAGNGDSGDEINDATTV